MTQGDRDSWLEIVVDETGVDPMAGLQDLGSLWLNERTEGLYQALLSDPGRAPSSDHYEPVGLFRRHHAGDPEGGELTAFLLCTDRRWRGAAGRVIREIEALGVLAEDALDHLAELFVWADDLCVDCRLAWLAPNVDAAQADVVVPVRRDLRPAVRRWAAQRRARRGGDSAAALVDRARALGDLAGGAVVSGLLDAAEALDGDERVAALEAGVGWSRAEVRRRALEVLAATGEAEEASRRAAADPAAQVRRWGAKLDASLAAAGDGPTQATAGKTPPGEAVQGSLLL